MRSIDVLQALVPIDARNIGRDPLMRWMLLLPLLVAALVRFGVPPLSIWLARVHGVVLGDYELLIGAMLVMVSPIVFGSVIGFLLLDQKDDGTLIALQVTPLSSAGYVAYRLGLPMVISVVMTVVTLQIGGVGQAGLIGQVVAGLGAAPLAPAFALFLGAFAQNKIQGFALAKAVGVLNWPPLVAWFVDPPWHWLYGLCPTFWPVRIYWDVEAGRSTLWFTLPLGLAFLSVLDLLLLRRFDRELHR